jgi:hypothetical protein
MIPRLKIIDTKKIIPDAYHGTSKELSEKILTTNKFKISTGGHQYVGDGVYFFESQKEYAVRWARKKYGHKCDLGILCAVINLGRCLNLTSRSIKSVLIGVKKELEDRRGGNITDAAVVNFIATNIVELDTIKCVIITPRGMKQIYPGSHLVMGEQVIICVRNISCIMECKLDCTIKGD